MVVRELLEEWSLTPDGAAMRGHTALVVPVRTTGGRPAVLKICWPHPEAEHEALALQHWHGRGAVQLLRADPHASPGPETIARFDEATRAILMP